MGVLRDADDLEEVLDNEKQSSFYDYVGCSKGSCWLCHHAFINITKQFKIRNLHLKIRAEWESLGFKSNRQNRGGCIEVLCNLNDEMSRFSMNKGKSATHHSRPDCTHVLGILGVEWKIVAGESQWRRYSIGRGRIVIELWPFTRTAGGEAPRPPPYRTF